MHIILEISILIFTKYWILHFKSSLNLNKILEKHIGATRFLQFNVLLRYMTICYVFISDYKNNFKNTFKYFQTLTKIHYYNWVIAVLLPKWEINFSTSTTHLLGFWAVWSLCNYLLYHIAESSIQQRINEGRTGVYQKDLLTNDRLNLP